MAESTDTVKLSMQEFGQSFRKIIPSIFGGKDTDVETITRLYVDYQDIYDALYNAMISSSGLQQSEVDETFADQKHAINMHCICTAYAVDHNLPTADAKAWEERETMEEVYASGFLPVYSAATTATKRKVEEAAPAPVPKKKVLPSVFKKADAPAPKAVETTARHPGAVSTFNVAPNKPKNVDKASEGDSEVAAAPPAPPKEKPVASASYTDYSYEKPESLFTTSDPDRSKTLGKYNKPQEKQTANGGFEVLSWSRLMKEDTALMDELNNSELFEVEKVLEKMRMTCGARLRRFPGHSIANYEAQGREKNQYGSYVMTEADREDMLKVIDLAKEYYRGQNWKV